MKQYSLDTRLIDLEQFKQLTREKKMLPGRVALQEKMDDRFDLLRQSGIETLGDLLRALDSKTKSARYAAQTGLSVEYLVLLKREAGSYLARPFPLSDFPGIPFEYSEILKSKGIKNTKNLFEQLQSDPHQAEMASITGIPQYRLKELVCLCDLSRITGVGGTFARVIYEAGIHSTLEFASTNPSSLLSRCRAVIEKHGYAAGNLGEKDIQYGINYANVVVACDRETDVK